MPASRAAQRGFSLIELVMVMVIVGILASMVAVFMVNPVRGYLDSTRRAGLVDVANTALMRIARDLRLALPNSVRVQENPPGSGIYYIEYLVVAEGGRYREELDPTISGSNLLDFASLAEVSFDVLGPAVSMAGSEQLVFYNLGLDADTDAYQGGNRRAYNGAAGEVNSVNFAATGSRIPFESPARRFFAVSGAVTYACNPTTGELRLYQGYGIQAAQPNNPAGPPLSGASSRLLADHVTGCRFAYDPGASERLGQLTLWLQLASEGESVNLYREVAVNNEP